MVSTVERGETGRAGAQLFERVRKLMEGSSMAIAGGGAGVIARTASAPFDRVKLLFQVQSVGSSGMAQGAYTSLPQAFLKVLREEGVLAFWKGNGTNVIRIAPYSAAQMSSNDFYKRMLSDESGKLSVARRLTAGALAGMTGTAITHPLDVVRLRLALPGHGYNGTLHAFGCIGRNEGVLALYKGIVPTLAGIAPYAACNFAAYDLIKTWYYKGGQPDSKLANLVCGGAAGTFAATVCYPLDTVRRRMQMRGSAPNGIVAAVMDIMRTEGFRGLFNGWTANTIKVVPQNSIRFVSYELLKGLLGVNKAKSDT